MKDNRALKDRIISDIAASPVVDKIISEDVISKIVQHQFETTLRAFTLFHSVEISGFGKFLLNDTRVNREMEKYRRMLNIYDERIQTPDISDAVRRNLQIKIATIIGNIKSLKPKERNNENSTDYGGSEE